MTHARTAAHPATLPRIVHAVMIGLLVVAEDPEIIAQGNDNAIIGFTVGGLDYYLTVGTRPPE